MNEQQGSRGEANFVWKCQNCKVNTQLFLSKPSSSTLTERQRQHSANVMEAPKAYPQQEPAKAQNILLLDCRGLEFVEFKAEVRPLYP